MNQYSYNRYNPNYMPNNYNQLKKNNDDRFVGGGFLAPFLLGGITGGLLAPSFYPRPIYGPIYRPYPVYPVPYQTPYVNNQYFY